MALNPFEVAEQAALSMLNKKASDVRILDLRQVSSIVDYFVIGSVGSEPQLKAVVEGIMEDLNRTDTAPWHVEGTQSSRWVLLDYVDVVMHIFRSEVRHFYGLERLWGDVPMVRFDIDADTGETLRFTEAGAQQSAVSG